MCQNVNFSAILLWLSGTSVYNVLYCKRLMSKVRQFNSYFFLVAFVIYLYNLFLTVHLGPFCVVHRIIRKNLLNSFLSLLDSNHVTSYSNLWAENVTFLILRIFVVLLHFSTSNWSFVSVCRPSAFFMFLFRTYFLNTICSGISFPQKEGTTTNDLIFSLKLLAHQL